MEEEDEYTVDNLSEEELFELTEKLLEEDENNCAPYFRFCNWFLGIETDLCIWTRISCNVTYSTSL